MVVLTLKDLIVFKVASFDELSSLPVVVNVLLSHAKILIQTDVARLFNWYRILQRL